MNSLRVPQEEREQGYARSYATCTLEGEWASPFPFTPNPRAERVRWLP